MESSRSRPGRRPVEPLFQAPGQAVPEPGVGRDDGDSHGGGSHDGDQDASGRCELPGCDRPVLHHPGNEGKTRYCCREHRRESRAQRRRDRYDDE
jgi:hypothetical protein